ncbi:hypothetical protein C0989_003810 [Termitomyces sp. Mn162]|nr:hypothetical protein C0989_003810 [Termitomyces sp. Mn162]
MQLSCNACPDGYPPSHTPPPPSKTNSVILSLEAILKSASATRDMCAAVAPLPLDDTTADKVWDAAHAEQARKWAEDALSRVREVVSQRKSKITVKSVKTDRPAFNHSTFSDVLEQEYTPLLEKYFEYNAYPSAPDRVVLARKCMMTPRQIEVWFQNHRNRAKKERRVLRRLTIDKLPVDLSLQSLEAEMPYFTIPDHGPQPIKKNERPEDSSSDEEESVTLSVI